jgi:hypothetical protein
LPPRNRRPHFERDHVRHDIDHRLIFVHLITGLHMPGGDLGFGNTVSDAAANGV